MFLSLQNEALQERRLQKDTQDMADLEDNVGEDHKSLQLSC